MTETKHECPTCGRSVTVYANQASVYHRCPRKGTGGPTGRLTRFLVRAAS